MRKIRWILPLILLLALIASCSGDGPSGVSVVEAGYTTEEDVPIPDDTLPFQLSEGVAGYDPGSVQVPVAETTPLTEDELQALLVRLPAVQTEDGDVQEYALPSESLPPPRPGVEVDIPFPPEETAPAIDVESGPVEVVRFSPEGDVPLVPRLSVTFNQPMVPLTSHDELAQQDVPVILTPDVPGHWRWVGTKTLFFEADVEGIDRFPMATEYTVEIPAGIESATGSKLAEAVTFTFRTPPPVLGRIYPGGGPQQLDPLIFASFDQAIDPDAVLESVEVKAGGQEYPVRLATEEEIAGDSRMAGITSRAQAGRWLIFRALDEFPKDTTVTVDFLPGTPSAEGPRSTEKTQSFSFQTYGPLRVVRSECAWGGNECPPFTPWSITFSNPLDADRFDPSLVSVEPKLSGMRVDVFGNSLQITGNSQGRTKYAVTLSAEITDIFGQKLGEQATANFQVGAAQAYLSVPGDRFVVMDPSGSPSLSVFSVNIPRINVEIYTVEAADFVDFLTFSQDYNRAEDAPPPGSRVVKRSINIQGEDDALTETTVDLSQALDGATGNLIVKIAPDAGPLAAIFNRDLAQRVRDYTSYHWVQVTQIGLDAFFDSGEVVAWANSLSDGAPLADVEISLWPDGKSGTTDANGIVKLALPAPDQQGATLLMARKDGDSAFIPQNSYYYSERDGWQASPASTEARYYVFDDRQMYRPEETVSIKGWIRAITPGVTGDVELLSQSAATSIDWVVTDPVGNEIGKGNAPLTELGGFDFQFDLPENVNLGYAQVQLTAMGGELQYSGNRGTYYHSFQIQEFRRPEFEVTASVDEGPFFVGGSATATVAAAYFAGGPLPGADTSWSVRASSGSYQPPNWNGFTFGTWIPWWRSRGGGSELGSTTFESRTDAAGEHNLRIDFAPSDPPGPVVLDASATVFDVNRQGWSAATSILVHPADRYVGLRSDRYFVERGDPLPVEIAVTDLDGNVDVEHEVNVRAALLDWEYKNGDWQQVEVDVQECTVRTTAAADPDDASTEFATCTFETTQGGQLQITASISDAEGRKNQSQITRWIGGGRGPVARTVEQEEVQLIPSGETFQPGDVAELLVQAPFFPAEGLVTLRRGGLVSTERFTMDGPTHVVKVPIEDSYIPEIRVQVDLVGAAERVDDEGNPLTDVPSRPAYAMGSLTLSVPPISRQLTVEAVPQENRLEPGGQTTLDLVVNDASGAPVANAELAVVVVDESILALTGYQLIDPISVFYTGRGDGVFDIHNRANLLLVSPEMLQQAAPQALGMGGGADMMRSSATAMPAAAPAMEMAAADSGAEAKQAGQPIRMRANFDPLALFAPTVNTDADGKASVEVTVPDNLTRYRVMVVAVGDGKYFGSGEASVTARLPLMVRPSAPRFLNFGDSFELPVVLQNQTDDDMTVQVAVKATNADLTGEGALSIEQGEAAGYSLTVPANNRVEVRFPTQTASAGTARFQFAGASGDYADAAEVSLPVWTPATTEAFAVYGQVDEGAIVQPLLPPDDVIPTYGGLEVSMSSTAVQALTDAFLYLVKYPYECSEQMASRILSVAALRDVLTAFDAEGLPTPDEINAAVARDIQNLQAMQDGNGGFPIWRRGGDVWPYYSIHVAHALVRAKLKDYAVPADMLSRSQDYLRNIENYIPSWYGERSRSSLIAYSLYVRKLMGDVDTAKANKLIADRTLDNLSMESIGWLLSVLSGDNASAQTLDEMRRYLNNRVTETAGAANFSDGYSDGDYLLLYSNRRADAVILEAMITDAPDSDLIPKLVRGLLSQAKRGRWGNTQENIFVLLAMDKYFNTYESQTPDFIARIWLGEQYAGGHEFVGRTTETANLDVPMSIVQDSRGQADADGNVPLIVQKDGQGRLYYRLGLRYAPTSLQLDPADHGFTVERTYEAVDDPGDVTRDADGVWHVKAGARVRVRLTMVAQSRRYHVALVDPIPAGFEALNPALAVTGDIPKDPDSQANPYGGWWWWGPWYE
ncbi:MAG: alpha-2-macroglobulin family protein, partial [Caldilineaceae bacterium]